MTLKELHHLCLANGVPPLLYKWSFHEENTNAFLSKKLPPIFTNMDSFIRGRNVYYIYFSSNSVLASKVGVSFLKAAYIAGFVGSRYTNPINITGFKKENWYDNGDVYDNLLTADFLVVDKVTSKLEPLETKVFEKFIEERLMNELSTIFVGMVHIDNILNPRLLDLFVSVEAKILTEEGVVNVT